MFSEKATVDLWSLLGPDFRRLACTVLRLETTNRFYCIGVHGSAGCSFVLVAFLAVSLGTWLGGAWVPGGLRPVVLVF